MLTLFIGDSGDLQQGWTDIPYAVPNLRMEEGKRQSSCSYWLVAVGCQYLAMQFLMPGGPSRGVAARINLSACA